MTPPISAPTTVLRLPSAMWPASAPAAMHTMPTRRRGSSPSIAAARERSGAHDLRSREPVAGAADGLDHVLAFDRRERLAQPLDVDVDRALLDEHVVAPDAVEQLRAAVDALGVRHQEVQQLELGRADPDLAAVADDPPRRRIERERADLDDGVER